MYKSPIEIYTENTLKEIVKQRDGYIFQEVQRIGVDVDKEELLRALKYDRNQYDAGYADGQRDAVVHGRWIVDTEHLRANCSECGKMLRFSDEMQIAFLRDEERFCYFCGAKMDLEGSDG